MLTGKLSRFVAQGAVLATMAVAALTPLAAHADPGHFDRNHGYNYRIEADNRQDNKNTWRDLGLGAAAVAAYGLLNHNSTATILGAAGAAYSADRYEQDRHSQARQDDYRYDRHDFRRRF